MHNNTTTITYTPTNQPIGTYIHIKTQPQGYGDSIHYIRSLKHNFNYDIEYDLSHYHDTNIAFYLP